MVYRNIKTGAELISTSVIVSPDWTLVQPRSEVPAPKEAPIVEPPKAEPPKEDPPKKEIPKEIHKDDPPKAAAKKSKSAPKKRAKK